jgi:hypothetical protein
VPLEAAGSHLRACELCWLATNGPHGLTCCSASASTRSESTGSPEGEAANHANEADDAVRQRPISNANRGAGRGCGRACRAGRPSSMSGSPATRPRSAAAGRVRPDQQPRPGRSRARRQPARPHPSTDAHRPSCSQAASAACVLHPALSSSRDPYAETPWTDHPLTISPPPPIVMTQRAILITGRGLGLSPIGRLRSCADERAMRSCALRIDSSLRTTPAPASRCNASPDRGSLAWIRLVAFDGLPAAQAAGRRMRREIIGA